VLRSPYPDRSVVAHSLKKTGEYHVCSGGMCLGSEHVLEEGDKGLGYDKHWDVAYSTLQFA
jgi:hypothetical protein